MVADKSTQPAYSLQPSAPLVFGHHFYGKRMLQHVPLVPFSGRDFNLLAAAGASFSRLLSEETLCGVAYAWLVL
jgi:hypothetical protein